MLYWQKKGMIQVDGQVTDLYTLPGIAEPENLDLQVLSESCSALEDQIRQITRNLPDTQRQVIEAYISARNDLEVETVKIALRWGKQHYK